MTGSTARWVAVWFEDSRTGSTTRLAALTLPMWPPLTMAGAALVAAGWMWRGTPYRAKNLSAALQSYAARR